MRNAIIKGLIVMLSVWAGAALIMVIMLGLVKLSIAIFGFEYGWIGMLIAVGFICGAIVAFGTWKFDRD